MALENNVLYHAAIYPKRDRYSIYDKECWAHEMDDIRAIARIINIELKHDMLITFTPKSINETIVYEAAPED